MYNSVGLPTARGSGTSGYVQRNLGALKPQRKFDPNGAPQPPQNKPLDRQLQVHRAKRQVELELLRLRKTLTGTPEEIEEQIGKERERKLLMLQEKVELLEAESQPKWKN